MSTQNPNYTLPVQFSLEGIQAAVNSMTMTCILERNQKAHSDYDAQVGSYDLRKAQVSTGIYIGPRPYPMVMLIPMDRGDGSLYPMEDPAGTLVCEPIEIPQTPPPLAAGVVAIGDLFPYDPLGRRACLQTDTMEAGAEVVYKGVRYVKVSMPTMFSGSKKTSWYQPTSPSSK